MCGSPKREGLPFLGTSSGCLTVRGSRFQACLIFLLEVFGFLDLERSVTGLSGPGSCTVSTFEKLFVFSWLLDLDVYYG